MGNVNLISAAFIFLFFLPILIGMYKPFTREKIYGTLRSFMDNITLCIGLILSFYVTKIIFIRHEGAFSKYIYSLVPEKIEKLFVQSDIITYLICVPFNLAVFLILTKPILYPIYKNFLAPLSERLFNKADSLNRGVKSFLGALSQTPKALVCVFLLTLILNFTAYYFPVEPISKWMNESGVYQLLYQKALYPVLNSNVAKRIPVLLNDSFSRIADEAADGKGFGNALKEEVARKLNIRVIEYFNGVTLDEAIKSNPEIDKMARQIVGNEKNSKKKAYLLYKWVSKNITYDFEKAKRVSVDPSGISSGSDVAYNTKKGICFDYSCLFISMCRAVNLKVRMVTGLGYNGVSWGDHAWNQVYFEEEKEWMDVDTTFGVAGDYFATPEFYKDHRGGEVQGEW
ncbi:MAG: transglutaminase-like domain-containing protein [Clostridia bacterium]|nr:transglutaminase-like domain-containing protein [Clostridia bacterium]